MVQTRTSKSILNSVVALLFYLGNIAITIYSRPVFLKSLGTEVQGLRSTLGTMLSTMSLAELGLGAAIAYALYRPLHEKDRATISDIISLQGWFYRKVALVVTAGAIILLCFFPYIFSKKPMISTPMWYAYATFLVLFFQMIIGYLVNYRSIIFNADQRGYRLTMNIQGFYIGKNVLQIAVLYFLPNPYVYYLLLEVVVTILGVWVLERMIRKDYPWLESKIKDGPILVKKYPEVLSKTKQIFVHKIGEIGLHTVTPLTLYAYTSLPVVTSYDNYMILVSNLGLIVGSFLNSIVAGIGSLVAERNKDKIMRFFWEYLALKNYLATIVTFAIYCFASHLIPLWLGIDKGIPLADGIVFWIALNAFFSISRGPLDSFLGAKGMYSDVWAPIAETALNVVFSITFGYFFGISGAIAGLILALFLIVMVWKSIYLFRVGFGLSPWTYWYNYLKYPLIMVGTIALTDYLIDFFKVDFSTLYYFFLHGGFIGISYIFVLTLVYFMFSNGFRTLAHRLWELFWLQTKQRWIK